MEPNNNGASSNPAADLEARLHAVRLGDPSSSQLQPLHPAATSSLLLNPQQVLAPTAAPVQRPPPHMPQSLPQVLAAPTPQVLQAPPQVLAAPTPHMFQAPPQVLAAPTPHMFQVPPQVLAAPTPHMFQVPPQVLAAPTPHMFQSPPRVLTAPTAPPDMRLLPHPHQLRAAGTRYFLPICASPFGVNPPSLNAPHAPTPSAAATPSRLNAGGEDYRPISLSHLSEVQSPPTLWNGTGSLHPYTPAFLRALRADADSTPLTQEEVRARLLRGSTEQYLVMSPITSAHVVGLLAEGDETVRGRVIACVRPIVHRVMSKRYPLFLALLHACNGKVDELKDIIDAMCNGKGFLMQFNGKEDPKGKALQELIRVVAWNRPLCQTLVQGLLRNENLMVEREGPAVLRHCFTMLHYDDCLIIFNDTLTNLDEILPSEFGWRCVAVCLESARNGALNDLEVAILARTSAFAMTRWSSYFLQHALRYGSEQFKARIVERVANDIVEVSVNKFGCFVVEACFLLTGSIPGLQRVLDAFLDLSDDDLAVVVTGWYSNYAVQKLLAAGKDHLPVPTTELARRIEALPKAVRKRKYAKLVMEVINKLFPAQPIQ